MLKTKVKICCIGSAAEAKIALAHGADVIGLVGSMPSGPGIIDDALIREIASTVKHSSDTFLLTSETSAEKIIDHHQRTLTTTIQLVDAVEEHELKKIKHALPNVKLVQVIHVLNENSITEAIKIQTLVDAILLDSGNPNLVVKELGGTGRPHNWNISKKIVEKVSVPVFLAGGLNASNVRQAIDIVSPYGVDVCSGVRTEGKLDKLKLSSFFKEIF